MSARVVEIHHINPLQPKRQELSYQWVCDECPRAGAHVGFRGTAATAGEAHNKAKHPTVTERI